MELATGILALLDFLAAEAVNQVTAIEEVPNPVPVEATDSEHVPGSIG